MGFGGLSFISCVIVFLFSLVSFFLLESFVVHFSFLLGLGRLNFLVLLNLFSSADLLMLAGICHSFLAFAAVVNQ